MPLLLHDQPAPLTLALSQRERGQKEITNHIAATGFRTHLLTPRQSNLRPCYLVINKT